MTQSIELPNVHPLRGAVHSAQHAIVGKSPAALALQQMVWLAASAPCPLLLTGESGTGKKDVALAVHIASKRSAYPYEVLNGADMGITGEGAYWERITACKGGTLFLDDIHALPHKMQIKILHLVDRSLVSNAERLNIRLIAATDQCLISLAGEGGFLPDLYYRLSLMTLPVPTLKQRRPDIPMIVEQMLLAIAPQARCSFDVAAIRLLCAQEWKGNLRELRVVIDRAALLHPGIKIGAEQMQMLLSMGHPQRVTLPALSSSDGKSILQPGFDLKVYLDEEEERFLRSALLKADGIIKTAAELAGIKRTTFMEKMRRHGINRQAYRRLG